MRIEIVLKDQSVVIENAVKGFVEISEPETEHRFEIADIIKLEVIEENDTN